VIRPFLRLLAAIALVGGLASCSTPTLPLPPPAALSASAPDASGFATVTGEVQPEAFVFCINEETMRGVIERPDATGRFTLRIEAEPGHYLSLWQEIGTDQGPKVPIEVPAP
jgi:hypothetical protein